MQFDQETLFSDKQVLTGAANSTNHYNARAKRNLGAGEPVKLVLHIGTPVSGTGPTLAASFVGADDEAFTVNKITIASTPAAAAVADSFRRMAIPSHAPKQYFRMEYTPGGTTPSIPVTAGIVKDEPTTPMT